MSSKIRLSDEFVYEIPSLKNTKDILFKDKKYNLQYWNRIEYDIRSMNDVQLMKFVEQEYERRINGVWFYNDGNPTYITGNHYFYLQYCQFPQFGGIYPEYRDVDRRFFYMWDIIENDADCLGLIRPKFRRLGATAQGEAIMLNKATMIENYFAGIVSKGDRDAKNVLRETMQLFNKMDTYMQPPILNNNINAKEMVFVSPQKKMTSVNKNVKDAAGLGSTIQYAPLTLDAFDGKKKHFLLVDEGGKFKDVSLIDFLKIHIPCLTVGANIIGKAYLPSTVEPYGLENYKKIYDDSDYNNRTLNNRTLSGLYRYFSPAFDGFEGFIDRYGFSVIDTPTKEQSKYIGHEIGAKEYLFNERVSLRDSKDIANHKNKFPFDISDAFYIVGDESPFNMEKLNEQKEYNSNIIISNPTLITRGNFDWKYGSIGDPVEFRPNGNGRFLVSWIPTLENQNKIVYIKDQPSPANDMDGIIGIDPVDQKIVSGKGSNFAALGFRYASPVDIPFSNMFVFQYINRLEKVELMYEDMLKAAIFYGYPILAERAKNAIMYYIERIGYKQYNMFRPEQLENRFSKQHKQDWGLPTASDDIRNRLIGYAQSYIYDNIGYIRDEERYGNLFFNELVDDWISFNPKNWTPSDISVASFMCLAGARQDRVKLFSKKNQIVLNLRKFN